MAKTDYKTESLYVLSGALLNHVGQAINSLGATQEGNESERGLYRLDRLKPITLLGVAQVVNADDDCAAADGPGDAYEPPCAERNFFQLNLLYWDGIDKEWKLMSDVEPFDLDASALYDQRQGLWKGEKLNCYFDPVRGMWVPIFPAPATYLVRLLEDLEGSDGTTATSALAKILVRNHETNAFENALDHEGADITVRVYSWYTATVYQPDKILVNRDSFGDLWMSSVDCP